MVTGCPHCRSCHYSFHHLLQLRQCTPVIFRQHGQNPRGRGEPLGKIPLARQRCSRQRRRLQHIDPNGSYIFMANHTSYIDTPVVLANISVQFRFLAKRGLFQIPFLGTHLSRAGHIPVPREDPRAAVKTLQLAAETIQQKKISLLIFPEGGRSPDGVLAPFKEGGAYIAIRAGVPVVPLVLMAADTSSPMAAESSSPAKSPCAFLPPSKPPACPSKTAAQLTEQVRNLLLSQLSSVIFGLVH